MGNRWEKGSAGWVAKGGLVRMGESKIRALQKKQLLWVLCDLGGNVKVVLEQTIRKVWWSVYIGG